MNSILKLISFLIIAISLIGCNKDNSAPEDPGWEDPGTSANDNLIVMSYNIRHCAPYYGNSDATTPDPNNIATVIKKTKPDVVFLQEVDKSTKRSLGIDQAKKIAEVAGYPYYQFFKMMDYQGGEYGLSILSALPLKDATTHTLPKEIDAVTISGNNSIGSATIEKNGNRISLIVVHLSVYASENEKQLSYINKEIVPKLSSTAIIAGDFNSLPSSATVSLLDEAGFTRTNTDPLKYTIPSTSPNREIDYIAYKPKTKFSVFSHIVVTGTNASDHLPIVSVLKIEK